MPPLEGVEALPVAPHDGHQRRHAVDHGRVHHLPPAGPPRLQQPAYHAEGEEQPAAADVAHQVQRRHRRLAGPPDVSQRARERHVVDVVTGVPASGPSCPQPVIRP